MTTPSRFDYHPPPVGDRGAYASGRWHLFHDGVAVMRRAYGGSIHIHCGIHGRQMHVALIMAKEGSLGLPNKNLLEFRGQSLLRHCLDELSASGSFSHIYVSTNGPAIRDEAERCGAEVIMRADEFAHNDRYIDAVNHAVQQISVETRPTTVTIPQVVQPLREAGLFARMLAKHGGDVDSVVTVTKFESSVDWIYSRDESDQLGRLDEVSYAGVVGRRDDLFEIDNAAVSFTYESWRRQVGITPWPYLGRKIVGLVQQRTNKNYCVDINTAEDAEWMHFIADFPRWKGQGAVCGR